MKKSVIQIISKEEEKKLDDGSLLSFEGQSLSDIFGNSMLMRKTLKSKSDLVYELLGESLMDIQQKYNSTEGFSLKTVLMIGIQLLERIETLHSLGLVH